jgi:hypothetical protein
MNAIFASSLVADVVLRWLERPLKTRGNALMLRTVFSVLLLCATFTLISCAGGAGIAMSAADRTANPRVTVRSSVQLPDQFSYQERGAGVGTLFGVIGALAEASVRSSAPPNEAMQMLALMKSSDIAVPDILRAEFIRAVKSRGGIRLTEATTAADADAELSLVVNLCGLGRSHLYGKQLHPTFNVTASMQRRDGSWSGAKPSTSRRRPLTTRRLSPLMSTNKTLQSCAKS